MSFVITIGVALFGYSALSFLVQRQSTALKRLNALASALPNSDSDAQSQAILWHNGRGALESLKDRLGKAGFLTASERLRAKSIIGLFVGLPAVAGACYGINESGLGLAIILLVVGLYAGALLGVFYLRLSREKFEREVLFQLPLALEAIILLVESGLGILPALERTLATRSNQALGAGPGRNVQEADENHEKSDPVNYHFSLVYKLAAHGMPFGQALQSVADACNLQILRHVLLHLDISGTQGGELIPALRNLSNHTHTEWRLSVERRVKRLENFVVFPVFVSVIGLSLLTAAVPLVPVLKLGDTMRGNSNSVYQLNHLK